MPPGLSCSSFLQLAHGVNSGQGLGIEIIGTLQLVLCVLATTDRRRRDLGGSAPLAIGLSVALGHLLAVSKGIPRLGSWGDQGQGKRWVSAVLRMELPRGGGWQTHSSGIEKTQGPLIMPLSPGLLFLSSHPTCYFPYIPVPYTLSPSRLTTLAAVSTLPGHLALLCSPATSQTTG